MEQQIKIYIQTHDLPRFTDGRRPTKFWTTYPTYMQNLVEVTIPVEKFREWNGSTSKTMLFD